MIESEGCSDYTTCGNLSDNKIDQKRSKPVVIVGSQCGAAILRGANVFAPGVLAAPHGISCAATEVDVYADAKNKVLKGTVTGNIKDLEYKSNPAFYQNDVIRNLTYVGRGVAMMSRHELFELKKTISTHIRRGRYLQTPPIHLYLQRYQR